MKLAGIKTGWKYRKKTTTTQYFERPVKRKLLFFGQKYIMEWKRNSHHSDHIIKSRQISGVTASLGKQGRKTIFK